MPPPLVMLAAAAVLEWSGSGASHLGAPSTDGRFLSGIQPESGELLIRDTQSGILRRFGKKTAPQERAVNSVFSPDSSMVAYEWVNAAGHRELRTGVLDTLAEKTLLVQPAEEQIQPWAFTPGAKQVLALMIESPRMSYVAMVSTETGAVRIVKRVGGTPPARLSLSPDGRSIAFRNVRISALNGNWEGPLVPGREEDADLSPVFSSDGRSVFYLPGDGTLWQAWPDGRKPALVQAGVGRALLQGVSQDGRIFLGVRAGVGNVYRAGFDATAGRLTSEPEAIGETEPQAGLTVQAGSFLAKGKELWREGGVAPVAEFPRDITALAVAADGETVAVAQATTLTVLAPRGRSESRAASETISGLLWTADASHFIAVQNDSLWWWSASLDDFRRLVKVAGAIGSVRFEPGDRAITFTAGRARSEIWSLAPNAR